MRASSLYVLPALLSVLFFQAGLSLAGSPTVIKVYTGAEAKLSDGRKIRYSGISVPNKKDKPFFRECLEANQRLVQDLPVIILVQQAGRSGRARRIPVLAFSGTLLINAELIRQGYALAGHCDEDFRYRELFFELQQEARSSGRGLWAYQDTFSEPYYIGEQSHRVFHRPDCPHVKDIVFEDRVVLRTKDDALVQGYVQDWRCCPLFRVGAARAARK